MVWIRCTLINLFLKKFCQELKKLSKFVQFPMIFFSKIIYCCVSLKHTLVKSLQSQKKTIYATNTIQYYLQKGEGLFGSQF